MSSPFASKQPLTSPVFTMGAMALILGLLIGSAWITRQEQGDRLRNLPGGVQGRLAGGDLGAVQEDLTKLQQQVKELREKNTEYETALAKQGGEAKALNNTLQDLKISSGLTELNGPGVVVTLKDSQAKDLPPDATIIHDYDILRVVNELWNAGAEAIAIGEQRVVTGTSIRCVGAVVRVNDFPMAAPIPIRAIGDPVNLANALALPGGVIEELRETDKNMVTIESIKEMKLPAFSGSTTKRWAKVPVDGPVGKGAN